MSKPATVPTWATDSVFATGSETGLSVILEPATGVKAQGCVAGEEAPARWLNWLLNAVCAWTAYLDGLITDPDFVGADFAWTGSHLFATGGTVTVDTDIQYAAPVTVQQHAVLAGSTGDVSTGWAKATGGIATLAAGVTVTVEVPVPAGSTFTTLTADVLQPALSTGGGAHQTQLLLYLCQANLNAATTRTQKGSTAAYTAAAGDHQTVGVTFTPFAVAAGQWVEVVVNGPSGASGSAVDAVQYSYSRTTATGGV